MTASTGRRLSQFVTNAAELSEAKLQEMIAALHDAPDAREANNASDATGALGGGDVAIVRRSALRIPVDGFAFIAPVGGNISLSHRVGVYDMSRTGIAVVDAAPLTPGQQFNALFPRNDRRPIEVLCTVRHCRAFADGYIIGAEFGVSWLSAVGSALIPPRPALR